MQIDTATLCRVLPLSKFGSSHKVVTMCMSETGALCDTLYKGSDCEFEQMQSATKGRVCLIAQYDHMHGMQYADYDKMQCLNNFRAWPKAKCDQMHSMINCRV